MFDQDDVARLLHIAEKTLAFPKLKSIHDAAMAQLQKIAETIKEPADLVSSPPEEPEEPGVDELGPKIERRA